MKALRLTGIGLALLIAVLASAWVRHDHAAHHAMRLREKWSDLRPLSDSLRPDHQIIWGLGTSLLTHGLDPVIHCEKAGQRFVFFNLGKSWMWYDQYERAGIIDDILAAHSEDQIWLEARELLFKNHRDWTANGTLEDALKSWWLSPMQAGSSRIWAKYEKHFPSFLQQLSSPTFDPLDPAQQAAMPRKVPTLDSTGYQPNPKNAPTKLLPLPSVVERRLTRVRAGQIDAVFEIPTSPFTRETNRVSRSFFEQSEFPAALKFHRPEETQFYFADYWDTGHMNSNGRQKMSRCLCQFIGARRIE